MPVRDGLVLQNARHALPRLIGMARKGATRRFLGFFTVNIRNRNTRAAYAQAAGTYPCWCEGQRIDALGGVDGIETPIACHTFRATAITDYFTNGGRIEVAQRMAGDSNAKTTGLYDRRNDDVSVAEVERIGI